MTTNGVATRLAMPHGNAGKLDPGSDARASTHAPVHTRARIHDDGVDVKAVWQRIAAVVWGDFAQSWIASGSTPTIRGYLSAARAAPAPYGKRWLRWGRIGWVWSVGVVGTVAGHVLAHILQSPVRTAATLLVVGTIVLIRVLG